MAQQEVRSFNRCEEDWPFVWAIRDPEQLDWQKGPNGKRKPDNEIEDRIKQQAQLPVQLSPNLFLSDIQSAHNISRLKALGITHLLNMAGCFGQGPVDEYQTAGITVMNMEAEDDEDFRILGLCFAQAYEFIESASKIGGKCVVHCVAGVNRSGVIVASYLMKKEKQNILDVVAHCRRQRGNDFLSNYTFQEELVAMARQEGLLGPKPGDSGCLVTQAAGTECFE